MRLERPTPLALKTYREAVLGTGKDPAKVGGSAKTLFDGVQDLVALNDPIDTDMLSKILRAHWPFSGVVSNTLEDCNLGCCSSSL